MKKLLSLLKLFLMACAVLSLSACANLKPRSYLENNAEYREKNLHLKGNYQALLKCWNDNARTIGVTDAVSSHIYTDIGTAEIEVGLDGRHEREYSVIIKLKKISSNESIINGYGTGSLGQEYLPEWIDTLKKCSFGS